MGWTPADVRACSPSDFHAAFEGWQMAKGVKPPLKQSDVDRHDELMAKYG